MEIKVNNYWRLFLALIAAAGSCSAMHLPLAKAKKGLNKERQDWLMKAAAKNDIWAIRESLAAGADVNAVESGWTPLVTATVRGNVDAVEMLLKAGANPNLEDIYPQIPLYYAAREGHMRIMQMLLNAGADVNGHRESLITPLYGAVVFSGTAKGGIERVKVLLAAGARVNWRNQDGETPLFFAARHGDPEVVQLLIAAGADINAKNSQGTSVLKEAVVHAKKPLEGNIEIVRKLVFAGADYRGLEQEPLILKVLQEKIKLI